MFLGAAGREPEAGHHFVEDEHNAMTPGEFAQAFQKTGFGFQAAMQRFHDHRGQRWGVRFDNSGRPLEIVVRGDEHVPFGPGRTGSGRVARGQIGRAAVDHACHSDGMLAMIGAFKAQHFRSAGRGVGHPQAEQGGFGSRSDEADALSAGTHRGDALGQLDGAAIERGEVHAVSGCRGGRLHDFWMRMPHQGRSPGHGEVQEFPPFRVPDFCTLAPLRDHQELVRNAEFTIGSAGKKAEGSGSPTAGSDVHPSISGLGCHCR